MLWKYARLYAPEPPAGGGGAAPAPAAPAATPTPAAAPAPAPAPAAAAAPPAGDAGGDLGDPFSDATLDAKFSQAGTPAPDAGSGKGTPPKPAAPVDKKIPTAADKAPGVPKELRAELDRVKAELATAATNRSDLERQLAEARAAGESTKALTAQIETEKQERLKLLAELRGLKKEKSPEFIAKYDAPFNRAAEKAKATIERATVTDPATGDSRAATWQDFVKLYSLDEVAAAREARATFGDDVAPIAMRYYSELHRLDEDRTEAATLERTEYEKRTAEETANRATNQQQIDELWHRTNKELSDKVEDYHDAPDDTEALTIRQQTLAKFDAEPKNLKEKIIKDAHIRQMVGFAKVAKLQLARKDAKIAELQAELDNLSPPVPGQTRRPGGGGGAPPEKSFEDGLRESVTA